MEIEQAFDWNVLFLCYILNLDSRQRIVIKGTRDLMNKLVLTCSERMVSRWIYQR